MLPKESKKWNDVTLEFGLITLFIKK
jgi:hypothetical protein